MLSFIKKLFGFSPPSHPTPSRPELPSGQYYVDETDNGKLFIEMSKWCPDCHHAPPRYMEGPSGGMSVNIFCGDCGSGFNITPVVEIAERIGRKERYIIGKDN